MYGNRSSPAIAHAGLQFTAQHPDAKIYSDAVRCISDNIYVDDLLAASRSTNDAIRVLEEIREMFQCYHIKLCKIVSNRLDIMNHFPEQDRAKIENEIGLGDRTIYRALGITWKIKEDAFIIKVDLPNKPLTRRGILSVTNSLYDPLGIVGPVILRSKLIQREALQRTSAASTFDWDEPLPHKYVEPWNDWLQSLSLLEEVSLPRSFIPEGFGQIKSYELHTFCDSSESAVAAVTYIRIMNIHSVVNVSYVISISKVTS